VTVELQDMRWAIIVSQHRSLRQAAETLNVRQSTLSRRLRDLEHQLSATLFERTNGGTWPTVAGQEFLDAARRVVEETEVITARLKTRSRGESGRLTIGVHASLSAGNFRAALIDHRHRFATTERVRLPCSSPRCGEPHDAPNSASSAKNLYAEPSARRINLYSEQEAAGQCRSHETLSLPRLTYPRRCSARHRRCAPCWWCRGSRAARRRR
jgi:DNA-binding transcriptional LysR family regulator